jgi:retron-type reverse transcriptase
MQEAEVVLSVLRERGRKGLPCEQLYRQMFNRDLYLLAYGNIYSNKGAMTPGAGEETADGMSGEKIEQIIGLMRRESYRFSPARRVYIPKKNGKLRPLGIPSWSDKLVGEVVRLLLEAYYEPRFSDRSHGFRKRRGCHTALREIHNTWTGVTWFIEGDISDCYGSLDHEILLGILAEKIHDQRFLRLIRHMLKAGYLEDWDYHETLSGCPQGGVVSPTLSNIYLDKLDEFIEQELIPQYTRGDVRAANPAYRQAVPGEVVPMTPMRKKIAERMVESKHTSAHVHSVFKVDMTRIARFREKNRKAWEARNGVKLTYLPFIAKALLHGIRVKPIMNSSVVGDGIQYHKNVNIGIAVALDWGLIVPVVKGAENLSFVGLQRAIVDLGERARTKKLKPDDVQSGTITITNPGIYGPQFGLPIILQPQVAILGMGGIFKEPVVVTDEDGNDSIAVRHIIRLSVGYDHRIIDGADADQFMVAVREYLENFNEDIG